MTRRLVACLLVAAWSAFGGDAGVAGAGKPQPPVFRVESEVVNVTATVWDNQGRLVSDLGAGDFVVSEDGRPQAVEVFARALDPTRYACAVHREVTGEEAGECYRCGARLVPDHGRLAVELALLLDTSESMLKELKLSQEAATRFLEAIPRANELYTIFFADDIRLSRYDSENQQGLFERIMEEKGGGNTSLYDAIAVYLSRVEQHQGRKVLVLFTDGEDSRSELSLGEVLELLRASGVTVYAIYFTGGLPAGGSRALKGNSVLQQIAEMTGGKVFKPHGSKDLPAIYRRILEELGAQYVLGFAPRQKPGDTHFRKLKVEVRRPGLRVRHRAGYYATPQTAAASAR